MSNDIKIEDVFRLVAGHSIYSGDSILSAFTCLSEGKDVKPIKPVYPERHQGEWIGDTDLDNTCKCSECRMTFDTDRLKMVMCDGKYELPPCCPNCGANMRGEKE